MSYFHTSIPVELEKALKSSGNIHNPAVIPLAEKFIDALKEKSYQKSLFITNSEDNNNLNKIFDVFFEDVVDDNNIR